MTSDDLLAVLLAAQQSDVVRDGLDDFLAHYGARATWAPLGGRENNSGTVEVSADPGRAIVERITNGVDAVLEAEHDSRGGIPTCRSPREAASAWLNVPPAGLSALTPAQRRQLGRRVTVLLEDGEGRTSRIVDITDLGIGISSDRMPGTILSLNESNKLQKHYLAGTYGQGGSATFANSRYTLIASRNSAEAAVGFTVVRYDELPADRYKRGHYVYLTLDGSVLTASMTVDQFPDHGTKARHFGYDLSAYPSPVGPNSLYGLLNMVLFDPVMPVWLDNRVHDYRRIIKGSRNALNGAVDEGDERRTGPSLAHQVRTFFVQLGDFGRVGIEYWVLEAPSSGNKTPIAGFVNPRKPVVITHGGQNQAELSSVLVRKHCELPYLTSRLICHVDCDGLTPEAKRAFFVSNREDARRGSVYEQIERELISTLKSDDELTRLNNEARHRGMEREDEGAQQMLRNEVARLLRIHGLEVGQATGTVAGAGSERERPTHPRRSRGKPEPIAPSDPPTFIRLVWDEEEGIPFYGEQRRYIRIETDASSAYHDPNHPERSRVNVILTGPGLRLVGSTPLQGGRMRIIVECAIGTPIDAAGVLRVELSRAGLPTLGDERTTHVVQRPPARSSQHRISLPPFVVRKVTGPDDPVWLGLQWPGNVEEVASAAEMEGGVLVVYYSEVFPQYLSRRMALEQRDTASATSFQKRYETWLAVHALLLHHQEEQAETDGELALPTGNGDDKEEHERRERIRLATVAAMFAQREVKLGQTDSSED